jgi:hypothetical protein
MFKNRKIKKNRIEIAKNFETITKIEDYITKNNLDVFDRTTLERDMEFLFYEMRCLVGENKRLAKGCKNYEVHN